MRGLSPWFFMASSKNSSIIRKEKQKKLMCNESYILTLIIHSCSFFKQYIICRSYHYFRNFSGRRKFKTQSSWHRCTSTKESFPHADYCDCDIKTTSLFKGRYKQNHGLECWPNVLVQLKVWNFYCWTDKIYVIGLATKTRATYFATLLKRFSFLARFYHPRLNLSWNKSESGCCKLRKYWLLIGWNYTEVTPYTVFT